MEKGLKAINDIIKNLCEPSPKIYPSPSTREFIWNRNILSIRCCLFFVLSYLVFMGFSKFLWVTHLGVFIGISETVLVFILLSSSHPWFFKGYYLINTVVFGYFFFELLKESTYFYISYNLWVSALPLLMTGDVRLSGLVAFLQAGIFLTKFKENLTSMIREEEPEVFTDKLIQITLFSFLNTLLVNTTIIKTLDQSRSQLAQVTVDLENALDQQKTFILSFSHELRNPLNSLLGNLQLVLQGEVLSTKMREMVNIAKVCGEILLHNINNVLDTGKHNIGKLEVNPISTQLYELFQRTWGIYSESLKQKKLKAQLIIDKDVPPLVKIDSHKVNQILLNLVGNSTKFTEKGSITVNIKWLKQNEVSDICFEPIPYDEDDEGVFEKEENLLITRESRFSEAKARFQALNADRGRFNYNEIIYPQQESEGILKIIVKDTGSGMKKEALEKLFEKFSQVSEHISQRQIGTGLGLFITREICLAMKGEIRAYSKFQTGTTFVVCIPTISIPPNEVHHGGPNTELKIRHLAQKRLKVLVADDSPLNVNLTCNYFSQFGASVVSVAYNGYEAFMRYKECHIEIDIVTLDIDMPVMDGRTACDRIRKFEEMNGLKPVWIILISGNYEKKQIDQYLNPRNGHRADCFLRKPVSITEFNRAIYHLVVGNPSRELF